MRGYVAILLTCLVFGCGQASVNTPETEFIPGIKGVAWADRVAYGLEPGRIQRFDDVVVVSSSTQWTAYRVIETTEWNYTTSTWHTHSAVVPFKSIEIAHAAMNIRD